MLDLAKAGSIPVSQAGITTVPPQMAVAAMVHGPSMNYISWKETVSTWCIGEFLLVFINWWISLFQQIWLIWLICLVDSDSWLGILETYILMVILWLFLLCTYIYFMYIYHTHKNLWKLMRRHGSLWDVSFENVREVGLFLTTVHPDMWLVMVTLQGTNISHLGKRKVIFKSAGWEKDILVPARVS